jgi:hypothetical protein
VFQKKTILIQGASVCLIALLNLINCPASAKTDGISIESHVTTPRQAEIADDFIVLFVEERERRNKED